MTVHSRAGGRFEKQPTLPLGPLATALVHRRIIPLHWTVADLQRAFGLSRFAAREAVKHEQITIWLADKVATQTLAVHPITIWGDDWLDPAAMWDGHIEATFEYMRAAS